MKKFLFILMLFSVVEAKSASEPVISDQQMLVNLMVMQGNAETLVDGMRMRYNTNYLTATTDDIIKMNNPTDRICSWRENKELIVEKRPWIIQYDTTFLRLTNLYNINYRMKFYTINFIQSTLVAFLQDNWKRESRLLMLNGDTTNIDFNVTSDPASYASNRFKIVFINIAILPIDFKYINAYQQADNVTVQWGVANQTTANNYTIQRSSDGINFTNIGIQQYNTNDVYSWLDTTPLVGDNFYRVYTENTYSNIVRVTVLKHKPRLNIYPNPIIAEVVKLQFLDFDKGSYNLTIINNSGQVVHEEVVLCPSNNFIKSINVRDITRGHYYVLISNKVVQSFIKN